MKKMIPLVLGSALVLSACNDTNTSEVLATYQGGEVTKQEAEAKLKEISLGSFKNELNFDTLNDDMKNNIIKEVVASELIHQEARKERIAADEQVKENIERFTRKLLQQELIKRKAEEAITEEALRSRYDTLVKDLEGKTEIHARHILVKTEEQAKKLRKRLDKKELSFAKLAEQTSLDTNSAAKGGDLGYFTPGQMIPEFDKAAFALKKGEISQPVKTNFGWHIIKLEDSRPAKAAPFDQVKQKVAQQLRQQVAQEYINNLLQDANIVYTAPKKVEQAEPEAGVQKETETKG